MSEVLKLVGVDPTAVTVKMQNAAVAVTAIAAATAPPSAVQEVRAARMPSVVVAAASVVKAGKTAVAATAAEGSKPHLK